MVPHFSGQASLSSPPNYRFIITTEIGVKSESESKSETSSTSIKLRHFKLRQFQESPLAEWQIPEYFTNFLDFKLSRVFPAPSGNDKL